MKKPLTQTIIVFVAVNLMMASSTLAQNVPDEEIQETSKEAIAAQKEAEIATKEAEKEVETARKQLEAAQKEVQTAEKQMKDAEKQIDLAQFQTGMDQLMEDLRSRVTIPRLPHLQHSGAVLVIPAAELKGEDLAAITEDMTVMSRIFDNKLSQARLTTGRGGWYVEDYNPFFGRDSGTIETLYLEGYAALFLMKVNFPISPSPEAQEEKKTEEEDTDPLWTQMRQEIYAPEEVRRSRSDDRPEEKYDVEKVEELKETLIKTLKHAANIRGLKPDQSVILTVIGGRSQSGTRIYTQSYLYEGSTGRSGRIVRTAPGAETGSFLPTVLTICVKKSDIDAFAKGELSFDQFRERTKIFSSYAKVGKEGSPDLEGRPVAHEGHSVFIR